MATFRSLSAKMATTFYNVMNENFRALKDVLENLNNERVHQEGFYILYYYMQGNFCNLIGLKQWSFSLI